MRRLPDQYFFPAIFTTQGDSISVRFPDFNDAGLSGRELDDAIRDAQNVLASHLTILEQQGVNIPIPTPLQEVTHEPGENVMLVNVSMPEYRSTLTLLRDSDLLNHKKASKVKKTLHVRSPKLSFRQIIEQDFADVLASPEYEQLFRPGKLMPWDDPDIRMIVDCMIAESWRDGEGNGIETWAILGTLDSYGFTFDNEAVIHYIKMQKHRAVLRIFAADLPPEVTEHVQGFVQAWIDKPWYRFHPMFAEVEDEHGRWTGEYKRLPEYIKFCDGLRRNGFDITDMKSFDTYVGQLVCDAEQEAWESDDHWRSMKRHT